MTTYSLPDFSSKLSLVITTGLHAWIQALAEKSKKDKLHVQSKLSPLDTLISEQLYKQQAPVVETCSQRVSI